MELLNYSSPRLGIICLINVSVSGINLFTSAAPACQVLSSQETHPNNPQQTLHIISNSIQFYSQFVFLSSRFYSANIYCYAKETNLPLLSVLMRCAACTCVKKVKKLKPELNDNCLIFNLLALNSFTLIQV